MMTNTSENQKQTSSTVRNYSELFGIGSISRVRGVHCSVRYGPHVYCSLSHDLHIWFSNKISLLRVICWVSLDIGLDSCALCSMTLTSLCTCKESFQAIVYRHCTTVTVLHLFSSTWTVPVCSVVCHAENHQSEKCRCRVQKLTSNKYKSNGQAAPQLRRATTENLDLFLCKRSERVRKKESAFEHRRDQDV